MSFFSQVSAVFKKEMRDAVRDRRSVASALLYPLFGPILIAVMFSAIARLESSDRPLEVPIEGQDNAPNLVAYLEERGLAVVEPPADPEAAVQSGDADLVLIIPDEYSEEFTAVVPAGVRIVYDSSKSATSSNVRRTRDLLRRYSARVGNLRLMARGISPAVAQAVAVEELDLATPAQTAARFFAVLPMFLMLAAFVGGLNVAIDTTAGERERQSLEPLLVNPVSRLALVGGKFGATSAFALAGALLILPIFLFMMRFVPLQELDVQLNLGPAQLLLMVVTVAPMALLASSAQMLVATFARSFKEAQTYVNLLIFAPMIPGFITQIYPLKSQLWMSAVPALAQQLLFLDIMGGEGVNYLELAIAGVVTTALALLLAYLTARLLLRERIVFGR